MEDIVRSLWRHKELEIRLIIDTYSIYITCVRYIKYISYNERSSLPGKFWPARKASRVSNCLEDSLGEIALAVKTRPNPTWTKRPRGALL